MALVHISKFSQNGQRMMIKTILLTSLAIATADDGTSKPNAPQPNSKIGIVGGGLAGVYTAYRLKKLGFKDVTIFEKTNRIGGKMHTLRTGGHNLDIGTVGWSKGYNWVYRLAEELEIPLQEVNLKSATDFLPALPTGETYGQLKATEEGKQLLVDTVLRYEHVRNDIATGSSNPESRAGTYDFFDQTTDDQFKTLGNLTMAEWAIQNNFGLLMNWFNFYLSVYLSGFASTVPAYYGLHWCTPTIIKDYVQTTASHVVAPHLGHGQLAEVMVQKENIRVVYNVELRVLRQRALKEQTNVSSIKNQETIRISYKTKAMDTYKVEKFNFFISAIHPSYYDKHGFPLYSQEKDLFKEERWVANHLYVNVANPNYENFEILKHQELNMLTPQTLMGIGMYPKYSIVNINNRRPIYSENFPINIGKSYDTCEYAMKYNHNDAFPVTSSCILEKFNQPMSKSSPSGLTSESWNSEHIKDCIKISQGWTDANTNITTKLNYQPEDFFYQYQTEFLVRYNSDSVAEAMPRKLFEYNLKNDRNTWFVGGYTTYESIGRIVDYIELILERTGLKEKHKGIVFDYNRWYRALMDRGVGKESVTDFSELYQ